MYIFTEIVFFVAAECRMPSDGSSGQIRALKLLQEQKDVCLSSLYPKLIFIYTKIV